MKLSRIARFSYPTLMKFLPGAVCWLAFVAVPLSAKVVQIAGENITLDVPDAFVTDNSPEAPRLFSATSADHNSAVLLAKIPNANGHAVTPAFIAGVKHGMTESATKAGGTMEVKSENDLKMDGAPAYLFMTESSVAGKKIEAANYVIATHDFYYLLAVQTTEAAKMPEMEAIANSFHFSVPPALPEEKSPADKLAYMIGVGVGVLLVPAALIVLLMRKRK